MFLITFVSIFPEIFPGALSFGLSGKSLGKLWDYRTVDIREFANDKHRTVDDTPYGGGAGMIMKPDIIHMALLKALSFYENTPQILYMTPHGKTLSQKIVMEIMEGNDNGIIFLCGRYEGIDQRVIDFWIENHNMIQISVGDYILFGGEIPSLIVSDACLRFVRGIMNNSNSTEIESFSNNLLEYPQYTKPRVWNNMNVPDVLISGHHENIDKWKLIQSEKITQKNRPDLFEKYISSKKSKV